MYILARLFFLLCLPGMIWHAPLKADIPLTFDGTEDYSNFSPWDLLKYETITFDNIFNFVQMIEYTDNLEEIFTEEQMEEIQEFLIFLMRNGIRDWDTEAKERLEEDIAWMRGEPNNSTLAYEDDDEEEFDYFMSSFNGYHGIKILPAVLLPNKKPERVLCKGKLKKFYGCVKRAARRHKKEIIIAAVVVTATVIIIASGGTATPEAVAGGASAIAGVNESSKSKKDDERPSNPVNKPGEVYCRDDYPPLPQDSSHSNDYSQNTSSIDSYCPQFEDIPKPSIPTKEIVQQQAIEIKEELAEIIPDEVFVPTRDEKSFWATAAEKAKETGAHITHEVYDAVTDQLSLIPDVVGAFSKSLPDSLKNTDPFDKDPRESYHEMVEAGHEKIDEIFGTDQADIYAAGGKAARGELTTGMLPPPGSSGNTKKSVNFVNKSINQQYITFVENGQTKVVSVGEMSHSGTIVDKGELTKAGRALQKHSERVNPTFPKPTGNPTEVNIQGQKMLDEILNHPDKQIIIQQLKRSNNDTVIDVFIPNGHGARFTKDGKEMVGFLEPKK